MCIAMLAAILYDHQDYTWRAGAWYTILFVKFVSACGLHIMIYPAIGRTMTLMKYVMNHEDRFTHPMFAFVLLLWALFILFLIEALNIF